MNSDGETTKKSRYTYRAIGKGNNVKELVFDETLSIIMDKLADGLIGYDDTVVLVITKGVGE